MAFVIGSSSTTQSEALQGAGISLHRTHFETLQDVRAATDAAFEQRLGLFRHGFRTLQEIKSYWEKDPICPQLSSLQEGSRRI